MNETTEPKTEKKLNYKLIMIFPIIFLILSVGYLLWLVSDKGLNLDIDLKGGTQISAESQSAVNADVLENILKDYEANVRVAKGVGRYSILIEFDSKINFDDILKTLQENGYNFKDYSVNTIGPSLGIAFFKQAQLVLLVAFIFMAITVFIIFRVPMPSFYVVLCGFADILETLVISQILGIKLSLATFSALLLLLGYSVDTDILLTTRVLKTAEGELSNKIKEAMRTGITMIGTTTVALFALFTISISSIITQIASVLLIGLLVDILNTWALNAALLRWYVERKKVYK